MNQQTLGKPFSLEGTGVHTGGAAALTVRPAEAGHGIVFRRTDVEGSGDIPATVEHVVDTTLGTTLGVDGVVVHTVEHLMAALASQGVDNCLVEVHGAEIPIGDGSFLQAVEAIRAAGVVEQDAPARVISLESPFALDGEGGSSYVVAPWDGLKISATIDFDHPAVGRQSASFDLDAGGFDAEIAPARTFGFEADGDALRARGLARGAGLENSIIVGETGVLNGPLRFDDEFVRHKMGDLAGDLALAGGRVRGHVVADRPSHKGNVALVKGLLEHARRSRRAPHLDINRIMDCLPHRYPMLMVDRIVDFEAGKRIVGIKNVSINEPFFEGHYPGHPIMPGVLIVEAMAQVGGLLLMEEMDEPGEKVVYFMSADEVKWRRPVTPGDTLVIEAELLRFRGQTVRMAGKAFVDGKLAAEAEFMARIVDK
ncbi:MAG: bifunctional UDP-3-O-[3-hydroxymyristoyl] N-acetylglucosamine deacetylase/3-hydroxyacyl-ACP dehydratase [Gemmatimonadota bacterium]|nr:bifunctional UDP-3-O-[3-hydroxymyristoyl] N-acetylglucosamine deacetylase/3-hydroxyacyl-ACP dehydratase [Gemmatimonadota bacterium]